MYVATARTQPRNQNVRYNTHENYPMCFLFFSILSSIAKAAHTHAASEVVAERGRLVIYVKYEGNDP